MAARKKTPDILSDILGETPAKKGGTVKQSTASTDAKKEATLKPQKAISKKMPKRQSRKAGTQEMSLQPMPKPDPAPDKDRVNNLIKEKESQSASRGGANDLSQFVSFKLQGQRYALPLQQVERALRMVALVPIPESPLWIAGMLNLHSRAIPVMDLRCRFGLKDKAITPDDRLLLVRTSQTTVGLRVDEVCDVLEIQARDVEPAQEALGRSRPLKAVIRRDEELVMVLDVEKLEPETE